MEIKFNFNSKHSFERKLFLDPRIDIKILYFNFKNLYFQNHKRVFEETDESKLLVYTLLYYFCKKENFYQSPLLYEYPSTKTNINKGLVIIGGVGTGKTTVLETIRTMINQNILFNLKFKNTKEAVTEYESTLQEDLYDFHDKLNNGHLIIDDLLAENTASRFGKTELFEDILFKRCENKNMTTIITINYLEEHPNNVNEAILSLYHRYGQRVFDRILGHFNFIQLTGKSFR